MIIIVTVIGDVLCTALRVITIIFYETTRTAYQVSPAGTPGFAPAHTPYAYDTYRDDGYFVSTNIARR